MSKIINAFPSLNATEMNVLQAIHSIDGASIKAVADQINRSAAYVSTVITRLKNLRLIEHKKVTGLSRRCHFLTTKGLAFLCKQKGFVNLSASAINDKIFLVDAVSVAESFVNEWDQRPGSLELVAKNIDSFVARAGWGKKEIDLLYKTFLPMAAEALKAPANESHLRLAA